MKYRKRPDVKGLLLVGGVLTLHSAEDYTTEFCEVHAYRTGTSVAIPEGFYVLLDGTPDQRIAGVTLTQRIVRPEDVAELRVGILNNHRNAYEVKAGQPIAHLYLLKSREEPLEEVESDEEWDEIVRQASEFDQQTEEEKQASGAILKEPAGTKHVNQHVTRLGEEGNPNPIVP